MPHPFLVDQSPYLTHTVNIIPSTSLMSSTLETSLTSLDIYGHDISSTTSLETQSTHSRALSTTSTTTSISLANTIANESVIDRHCLAWMRNTEQGDFLFGSVASRGGMSVEERQVRRELHQLEERSREDVSSLRGKKDKKRMGHWLQFRKI